TDNGFPGPQWSPPPAKIPVLIAWGGSSDIFAGIVNFATMTQSFSDHLAALGFYMVHCNHGGGHTVPQGGFQWGFDFESPFTLGGGETPFAGASARGGFPDYCVFP